MKLIEFIKLAYKYGSLTEEEKLLIKYIRSASEEEKEEIKRILEGNDDDN